MSNTILDIQNLNVSFKNRDGVTVAVKNVSFQLKNGQVLGIVGESGSGKSVSSLSILNLLQSNPANRTSGAVYYVQEGSKADLLNIEQDQLYNIRGRKISMVFQEPMSALNPVKKCGRQVKEVLDIHNIGDKTERKDRVLGLLKDVSLPDVDRIFNSYPHELSGGQLQRVCIAMAMAASPDIIICDEPTTALDVTVQSQIIELLRNLSISTSISLIFISHDLDIISSLCDSVLVMYKGEIVEMGSLPETFKYPAHPYTQALIACKPNKANREFQLPTVDKIMSSKYEKVKRVAPKLLSSKIVLKVEHLKVHFPIKRTSIFGERKYVKAVDDVSFSLKNSEILGIVGESGSGKSTVANCIAGLVTPTEGQLIYKENSIPGKGFRQDKKLRTAIQLVFQDPYSSLNPRMSVGEAIIEPLDYHKIVDRGQARDEMRSLLQKVGLDNSFENRYPHQLSGGQRQRICIARALSVQPEILICDESVSALDVSVQAQILNLLQELRSTLGLSLIFISHDLSVIYYLCDRILVMKEGKIVETGSAETIMNSPQESYTKELISSLPNSIS